jgi:hypothetical protein
MSTWPKAQFQKSYEAWTMWAKLERCVEAPKLGRGPITEESQDAASKILISDAPHRDSTPFDCVAWDEQIYRKRPPKSLALAKFAHEGFRPIVRVVFPESPLVLK